MARLLIATCVGIPDGLTVADVVAAVEVGAAFVEANLTAPYPDDFLDPEFADVAAQVAPSIIRELVEPRALGLVFFCVPDASGACPGAGPDTPPTAPPAAPLPGRPSFTG